jgi:hypothetical protein
MVEGSVKRCTETMSERESLEAFVEGAKKSASAARELAKLCANGDWSNLAEVLDAMRVNGVKLSQMKSMSRVETLMAANIKQQKFLPQ